MKRLCLVLIIPCLLFSLQVVAEQSAITPQTQGEVTFVSGGVGIDERDTMRALQADYNLRLLFSVRGTGEYLSNVKISITDSRGKLFLESVSDGPMLFAKLKPGRYTITADLDGQVIQRTVTVGGKQKMPLSFTWAEVNED